MLNRFIEGGLVAAVFTVLLASSTAQAGHPALMEVRKGCETWVGKASGNDPNVRVQLEICTHGTEVEGRLQWSSLQSGWNVRKVMGRWDGNRLTARDAGILEEKPNPGWYFCSVDQYALTRSGKSLAGSYVAKKCNDKATLSLTLQSTTPASSSSERRADHVSSSATHPNPTPRYVPPPAPRPAASDNGTLGCSVLRRPPAAWLPGFLLVVVVRRSRRCRSWFRGPMNSELV